MAHDQGHVVETARATVNVGSYATTATATGAALTTTTVAYVAVISAHAKCSGDG